MTLFSTMFCDIKSEYCLDFINLFGLVLVTKSEGEIAGTRPSTTIPGIYLIWLDFNLILYLFHKDYIQPEATSSSLHDLILVFNATFSNISALMTLFSTMFCDIKSEYCLGFINLLGPVLETKLEGEIAGTRPSTILNINVRRWYITLVRSIMDYESIIWPHISKQTLISYSAYIKQPGSSQVTTKQENQTAQPKCS
jgi:hypothetical protein